MKAVRLLEYGGQLVFDDVPTPTIARDEILVKIKSTAVNGAPTPPGWASRTSSRMMPPRRPTLRTAPSHDGSNTART